MTSKLYIPNDTGKIIAEIDYDISNKQMTECNFHASLRCTQILLKPIFTCKERTKYYHMQQYFDGPLVLNRDEDHVKMAIFQKGILVQFAKTYPGVKGIDI